MNSELIKTIKELSHYYFLILLPLYYIISLVGDKSQSIILYANSYVLYLLLLPLFLLIILLPLRFLKDYKVAVSESLKIRRPTLLGSVITFVFMLMPLAFNFDKLSSNSIPTIPVLFFIVLLQPTIEEISFRGYMLQKILSKNIVIDDVKDIKKEYYNLLCIGIVSISFAFIHIFRDDFIDGFMKRLLAGCVYGIIFVISGRSVHLPIAAHIFNNLVARMV